MKNAPRGRIQKVRGAAGDGDKSRSDGFDIGKGAQKPLSIGMLRVFIDVDYISPFHNLAAVHNNDEITRLGYYGEIVSYEDHRDPKVFSELLHHGKSLRRNNDI